MASPDLDRALVRRFGYAKFVELAWPVLLPETPLIWEPHLSLICNLWQAVLKAELKDMVVNVPPGTSKSLLSSVLFQPYAWTEQASLKFMCTTFSDELTDYLAGQSLKLLNSAWYRERWPHVEIIKGERASVGHFINTRGGERVSTSMGGQATGRHADILIVDDPVKPKDIDGGGDSARDALEKAWKTLTNTFFRRTANAASFRRVIVMQRLHHEDPAGRMAADPSVLHVRLPMEFVPEKAFKSQWGSDWRTEPGELLSPKRFPKQVVESYKHSATGLSTRDYASQMQQDPSPEGGEVFKREYFARTWDALPPLSHMILSVDATFKETDRSDFVVLQVWAKKSASEIYFIDQLRARMGFDATEQAIDEMIRKWPQIRDLVVEDKANGSAIIQRLRKKYSFVTAVNPEGGKEARANAVEPVLRSQSVLLPAKAVWLEEFIREAIQFPLAAHDDQVDAMTQAVNYLTTSSSGQFHQAMVNLRAGHSKTLAPKKLSKVAFLRRLNRL